MEPGIHRRAQPSGLIRPPPHCFRNRFMWIWQAVDCDATASRRAAFVPSASHPPLAVTIPFLDWRFQPQWCPLPRSCEGHERPPEECNRCVVGRRDEGQAESTTSWAHRGGNEGHLAGTRRSLSDGGLGRLSPKAPIMSRCPAGCRLRQPPGRRRFRHRWRYELHPPQNSCLHPEFLQLHRRKEMAKKRSGNSVSPSTRNATENMRIPRPHPAVA